MSRFYPETGKGDPASETPGKSKRISLRQGISILYSWTCDLGIRGILAILSIVIIVVPIFHYHNILLDLRYNCKADWADVEAMMQARSHIRQGLISVVMDYSHYERDILTNLTQLRVGPALTLPGKDANSQPAKMPNKDPNGQATVSAEQSLQQTPLDKMTPQQMEAMFARIKIVAEQYPQIKASENYQQFGTALVESERKIAELIMKYNNDVNIYTTARETWPARLFAWILGFENITWYAPDASTQLYEKVEF